MAIITISGKMSSGKDTLAALIRKNNYTFTKIAFADKLKYIVAIMCDMTFESQYTEEGKNTFIPEFNMTCGEMQQTIGTNVLRNWDLDCHVKMTKRMIKPGKNYIISDARFGNEAKAAQGMGAYLIRVEVRDAVKQTRVQYERDPNHPSEVGLDDWTQWHKVVRNNAGLKELEEQALEILKMAGCYPNWFKRKVSNFLYWMETTFKK
jgi:hypothetical protein